jgi:NTP pyrophosphatase (non-canonical NTP hydrolase)
MNLKRLGAETLEILKMREQNGGKVSSSSIACLKHAATEVVEATEAYTKWQRSLSNDCLKSDFASELADVFICILNVAEQENIDLTKAIYATVQKNRYRAMRKGDKL